MFIILMEKTAPIIRKLVVASVAAMKRSLISVHFLDSRLDT